MRILFVNWALSTDEACALQITHYDWSLAHIVASMINYYSSGGGERNTHLRPVRNGPYKKEDLPGFLFDANPSNDTQIMRKGDVHHSTCCMAWHIAQEKPIIFNLMYR